MTGIIPAFSIGGITRPALYLDGSGNIVLDHAAAAFAAEFGLKALYLGCPPGTPYPPVPGSLSAPVDTNATANNVLENAAPDTPANITASSTSSIGNPVAYSLIGDTSNGGFKINPTTGVVSVADGTKIDFETSPGHAYTITVQASDGILTSTQNFTIGVANVNEAPQGTSSHVATNEDNAHVFTVADFGFSDPHDNPTPNALQSVHIGTVVSGAGSLTNNGNPVVAGSVISAADIAAGHLVFTPAANTSGSNYASFTFQVQDDGGTANGGVDTDPSPKTITIDVNFVNDAPSFTIGANQTTLEDSGAHVVNGFATGISAGPANEAGQSVNFLVSNDNHNMFSVQPSIDASGNLTYTLAANANGSATVSVQAHDNGGIANGGIDTSAAQTFTIGATPVNDAPIGTSNTLTILEDHTHTFTAADFGFTDPADAAGASGGNNFQDVILTTLPGAGTGTLTLSGGAVIAGQAIAVADIGNLVFTPTANANGSPEASFTFQVQDDGGTANGGVDTDPTARTFAFNVTSVNDAPDGADKTIGAQGAHVFVTSDFGFTDANDAAGASGANSLLAVEITALPASGTLTLNGSAVSAGQFVSATDITSGLLVFTPSGIASGSFTFQVQDNGGTANGGVDLDPTPNTITVNQDAPPVVTAGHTLSYTENDAATPIDPAVTVTDSDNANLAHATVQITGHYVNGEDVLGFTDQNGITGSFNATTGTLTLSGSASVANYQTALESVTYVNTSDNPSGLARTVTIIANDGTVDSAPATDTINVTPVNDPPSVVAGHTLNYTEKQVATAFDPAITVSDVDSANLASATVHITGNYVNGQDILAFSNTANITGTFDAISGTLTLTGSDTVADYQAALASVTYFNTSDNPSGLARTVTIVANDGAASSTPVTDTINVTPVDDAPVTTAGGTLNYKENDTASAIDPTVTVSDIDSANMSSATVAITGNYVNGQDILGFTNQNGITGSFNAATATLTLTGSSSVANYKTALESVTYFNSSDNPSGLDRTVSYTVNDGTLNSNTSTSTIHVTPVNDAPVVTFGAITGFTEPPNGTPAANSTPVTIAPNLTISDAEGNNLTSATFVLTDLKPSDALSVSGHAGSSGDIGGIHFDISSTASTETVTLTGTDTIAHYNAVLDLVQFNNTSENPDTTARSYTVTAVDDGGTANGGNNTGSANTTATVTAVDDAPTASVPADSSIGTAFSHTNLAISGLSVADIDTGSGNVTATISANNASLTFDTTGLASFTNNSSHTVTLTGTVAQVNTALATLTYNSDDGFNGSDTVTLNVNDNGHTGTGGPQTSGNQSFHVGVVPQVFYIDNSAGGSANLGTQADPFTSIAAFNAANPAGSGDYVVLEHGTGTYSEANGINLANGVNLIGGSQTLQFTNPVTSAVITANVGSGTDPTIKLTAGSADNGIDLLGTSGHTIAHVSVDTSLGSGMGISDDGNNVGTVAMSDITVHTAGGNGLNFTHGGTVTATGTNHLTSGTGIALDISSTTIGSNGLTFHDISDNGGTNGIVLNATGTSGHLTVTGTGTTAGSGGTIQNTTGDAVSLTSTQDVSLSNMNITGSQGNGILGNGVNGLVLSHDTVSGNGNSTVGDGEGNIYLYELSGSASHVTTFDNLNVSNSYVHNVFIKNTAGTLTDLVVTNSTFSNNGASTHAGDEFQIDLATGGLAGSPTATVHATHNTFSGNISTPANFTATGFAGSVDDGTLNVHLGDGTAGGLNTFDSNDSGITLTATGSSSLNFDVNDNTLTHNRAVGIAANHFGTGTVTGFLRNDIVGIQGQQDSGVQIGSGFDIHDEAASGSMTVSITGNTIQSLGGDGNGADAIAITNAIGTQDSASIVNATVTNNTIRDILDFRGLTVLNSNTHGTSAINLLLQSNTFSNADGTGSLTTARIGGAPAGTDPVNVTQANATTLASDNGLTVSNSPGSTMRVDTNVSFSHAAPATPPATPQLAALGQGPGSSDMLTMDALAPLLAIAIEHWATAGASAAQINLLENTQVHISDLPNSGILANTDASGIAIDSNAAGWGWFIDPTPADNSEFHATASPTELLATTGDASSHIDLLTVVEHELGHVLGLDDSQNPGVMNVALDLGERRLPDATDVAQANASTFSFQAVGATAPSLQSVAASTPSAPVVTSAPGNDVVDAGHGGGTLFGSDGADNFVFANVDVHASTPPPITHVTGYSFAQGDTFDFSALTSPLHASSVSDALVVRALEDPSGSFATLQVNTGDCSLGLKVSNWVSVAQLDGAHAGDLLNVAIDSHSAVHHAQIHVDLLA